MQKFTQPAPNGPALPVFSQVELATGQFPYKNCKTDLRSPTQSPPRGAPVLPGHMGFSGTSSPSSKTGEHSQPCPPVW